MSTPVNFDRLCSTDAVSIPDFLISLENLYYIIPTVSCHLSDIRHYSLRVTLRLKGMIRQVLQSKLLVPFPCCLLQDVPKTPTKVRTIYVLLITKFGYRDLGCSVISVFLTLLCHKIIHGFIIKKEHLNF